MAVQGLGKSVEAVVAAVETAARSTGVDFGYLLAQAKLESGLDPHARARTSSATGLYQFTTATWLDTVRRHGAAHGLGWAATAIEQGAAAAGSSARAAILELRKDAQAAALMAAEFASDNRTVLERRLGRAVDATELYLAHFLGSGGATKFLAARDADPDASAAAVAPAAARANRNVFYAADGRVRSLGEVFDRFAAKLGKALPPGGNDLPAALPGVAVGALAGAGDATTTSVVAAKAGTRHPSFPEMGPRLRGDDNVGFASNPMSIPLTAHTADFTVPTAALTAAPARTVSARLAYLLLAELGA